MPIFEISSDRNSIRKVMATTYTEEGLREKEDLQRLLKNEIGIVAEDTLIIAEEFCEWEDSLRRIDLLGLDRNANLVVFELKRTQGGGHMELQAVRYAAMVSTMNFDQAVQVYARYLQRTGFTKDARAEILSFLKWEVPEEDRFNQDVRIVLVSAEFSKELTTAVLWLNDRDMDIRCVRIKPHKLDDRLLIDVQQVIPLPEAAEYTIMVREREKTRRAAMATAGGIGRDELGNRLGTQAAQINAALTKEGQTAEKIAEVTRLPLDRVRDHLKYLLEDRKLNVKDDKGLWRRPSNSKIDAPMISEPHLQGVQDGDPDCASSLAATQRAE